MCCSFQNGTSRVLSGELGMDSLDVWAAEASSACCGVNLAFSGFGVGFVLVPKWKEHSTCGVNVGMNSLDVWAAGESSACCGVNLAFSGFGVGWVCVRSKMEGAQYLRGECGMNSLDVWAAGESSACCGVNLALSGLGCFRSGGRPIFRPK